MRLIKARRIADDKFVIRVFVPKHGVHVGQEGIPGQAGGSQPGYTHVAGGEGFRASGKNFWIKQTDKFQANLGRLDHDKWFIEIIGMKDGEYYADEEFKTPEEALQFINDYLDDPSSAPSPAPSAEDGEAVKDIGGNFNAEMDKAGWWETTVGEKRGYGTSVSTDDEDRHVFMARDENGNYFLEVLSSKPGSNPDDPDNVQFHEESPYNHWQEAMEQAQEFLDDGGWNPPEFVEAEVEAPDKQSVDSQFTTFEDAEGDEWARNTFPSPESYSSQEMEALSRYKNEDAYYKALNQGLRIQPEHSKFWEKDSGLYKDMRDEIDNAMSSTMIPEDITVYRGANSDRLTRQALGNQSFVDKAFVSTAMVADYLSAFMNEDSPALMEIRIPAGTNGVYMEGFSRLGGDENEILLDRGLTYEFVSSGPSRFVWNDAMSQEVPVWEVNVVPR